MTDDFEFDDFDDDDGGRHIYVTEEKKSELVSHIKPTASKKRRRIFNRDRVPEGSSEAESSSPSLTSSVGHKYSSVDDSEKHKYSQTSREPGLSQTSNPSLTTYDETLEHSVARGPPLSDESQPHFTASPGKRVHFQNQSKEGVSHASSDDASSDSGASDLSISQSTKDPIESISTKSTLSGVGVNKQSQSTEFSSTQQSQATELSSTQQSSCRSSEPGTPTRDTKRSPVKAGNGGKRSKGSNVSDKAWMKELDDNPEKPRKRRIVARPLFERDNLIGSIGRSSQSLREAGSSRLLHDEFVHMCNTLEQKLSVSGPDRDQLEVASQLLNLLSTQENRRALFLEGQITRKGEDSSLEALLNLIGALDEYIALEMTNSENTLVATHNDSKSQQFLDTMGMIVYMLAFDCTVSDEGISEASARNARDIRHEIIAHPSALRGILCLIRIDPIVSCLRANTAEACGAIQNMSYGSSPGNSSSGSVAASTVSSSHSVADPTKMGRFRKRRRQLFNDELCPVPERGVADAPGTSNRAARKFAPNSSRKSNDESEFDFDDMPPKKQTTPVKQKLDKISSRVIDSLPSPSSTADTTPMHTCSLPTLSEHRIVGDVSHSIPLIALGRIVSGKTEWCEKSCLDMEASNGNAREFGGNSSLREPNPDDERIEDDDNPLLQTNNMLGKSRCLPLLSRGLCETLAAILWALEKRSPCRPCISYLHDKFSSLTALVDDACLMNDGNREQLCREGYASEFDCSLVCSLTSFLRVLCDRHLIFDGTANFKNRIWDEMVLETLRSLTSLTHDNSYAAKEIFKRNLQSRFDKEKVEVHSLEVISKVLYAAASRGTNTDAHSSQSKKIRYDAVIFCLNILTNCIESSEGLLLSKSLLSVTVRVEMNGSTIRSKDATSFISWLTQWLVGQTESFRDAICAFGSESTHSQRRLEASENDQLVTAGNGFVLLASMLALSADDQTSSADSFDPNVHDLILANLPGNDYQSKLGLVKNLLTVFCNFYQVSIGDLSVAVTGPVKALIRKLDSLSLPA
jgi:hypothetical protein